jgi:hypothetical protein
MNEETKKRIAEFRFGVIHDLVGSRRLKRGERESLGLATIFSTQS